jgi:nitrogen fixation/metabolism regulation signal transduction histidine kinase
MTERMDSLLQFGSGRKSSLVHARVFLVVEKAVAAVKFHPDGQNVSITVGKFSPAEADIDARNLESAIYNLLLNACQAAARSTQVPEVKVHLNHQTVNSSENCRKDRARWAKSSDSSRSFGIAPHSLTYTLSIIQLLE